MDGVVICDYRWRYFKFDIKLKMENMICQCGNFRGILIPLKSYGYYLVLGSSSNIVLNSNVRKCLAVSDSA